jgi:hypothetical protein
VLALIFEDALHETAKETVSIPGDLASEAIHVVEEGILYDHFQRVLNLLIILMRNKHTFS